MQRDALLNAAIEAGAAEADLVLATTNMDEVNMLCALTAKRLAWGKLLNAGQTCVAPDYVLVDRRVKERLVAELETQFRRMLGDDPTSNPNFVRIVNAKHFARLQRLIEGEKVLCGGGNRPDPHGESGWIAPTLIEDTLHARSKPMQEEIFGPILPIIPYDRLSQALGFIVSREKPLALYLFTRSKKVKDKVFATCSFGGGCVNDTIIHLATHHMGFGGVGNSGMGSYHGKRSFDTFSHYRAIVDKATWLDLPMRYMPYKPLYDKMIRMFLK